jgi:very-short-patch-repair endonuclease
MRKERANPDRLVARIAARQHGVVSFQQLIGTGLDPSGICRRVGAGRLYRIHRGVYAVGHRNLTRQGWWMAAVLACGEGAVLSYRSAAMHWGLLSPTNGPVDVTVPTRGGRRRRQGIRVHRSTCITPNATTIRPTLEAAIAQAEIRRLPIPALPGLLHAPTRSELERRFLKLCRSHGLPKPQVNVRVGPYEVDFLWRDRWLIVETDGWETHGTRSAFEADRARDVELKSLSYEVVRFTYWQVAQDPAHVAAVLRRLFSYRAGLRN